MYRIILALFLFVLISVGANAATYTVSKIADTADGVCDADCSLREAIQTANATPADDTIIFDSAVFAIQRTIVLDGDLFYLEITNNGSLSINGLNNVQISGLYTAAVIISTNANVTLNGLTLLYGGDLGTLRISGGTVNLTNSTVSLGYQFISEFNGGGITAAFGATVNITNSIISDNTSLRGGGINVSNGSNVTVLNSTISGNSASLGGGISNIRGTISITNSTISGNFLNESGIGGGISNIDGTVNLTNSTITANSVAVSGRSGGIYNFSGSVNSRNSIIAGNSAPAEPDFFGTLTSFGYNLIGNTSGTTITGDTTGNILNTAANLAPLGFYGGKTMTNALLLGSPAINSGNSATSSTNDQRGASRIGTADIGAFELNNPSNGGTFTSPLPNGKTSFAYNFTIAPNSGSFTYSVTSGTLPNGLSLASNFAGNSLDKKMNFKSPTAVAAISGIPTQTGTFNFAITATDGVNSNVTNYSINVLAPTAASSVVSGRVFSLFGRGLANAVVVMTNQNGEVVRARTNQLGNYRFNDVQSGETYIFNLQSKRYQFASQVVNISEDLDGLNFFAQ
jgi:CSLREA domain-containing protein